MAKQIRYLIIFLLGLSITNSVSGVYGDQPPLRRVNFHILSGSRIRNVRFGVFDNDGRLTGSSRTGFPTSGLSRRYEYEGPMPLTFFKENSIALSDGTERIQRIPVAQITLPENQSDVMLLFFPNPEYPEDTLKYNIQWIDIRKEFLPPGHLGIYNTTEISFLGVLGRPDNNQTSKIIRPGLNEPVSIHPRASLLIAILDEVDELIQLYENTFECDSSQSMLFVIFPPSIPGTIHLGGKLVHIPLKQPPEDENIESSQ